MIITVEQKLTKFVNHYSFYDDNKNLLLKSEVKRLIFPKLIRLDINDNDQNAVCSAVQEDILSYLLETLPLVNLFNTAKCKYYYYEQGIKHGYFMEKKNSFICYIGNDLFYECKLHSGNYVSLYQNSEAMGLIDRKSLWNKGDDNCYRVNCNDLFDIRILTVFFIISDLTWFMRNWSYDYDIYHIFGDKGFDTKWLITNQ